jgi:hypothetical protein
MSSKISSTRRLTLLSSVLVLFLSAPVAFSQTGVVEFNDACGQTGTCCPSRGDVCQLGGESIENHSYRNDGGCNQAPGTGTCCEETGSICNGGGTTNYLNYYDSASGSC